MSTRALATTCLTLCRDHDSTTVAACLPSGQLRRASRIRFENCFQAPVGASKRIWVSTPEGALLASNQQPLAVILRRGSSPNNASGTARAVRSTAGSALMRALRTATTLRTSSWIAAASLRLSIVSFLFSAGVIRSRLRPTRAATSGFSRVHRIIISWREVQPGGRSFP